MVDEILDGAAFWQVEFNGAPGLSPRAQAP
jgi:hypothetical protein